MPGASWCILPLSWASEGLQKIHHECSMAAFPAFQAALKRLTDLSGKREDVLRRRLALRPAALCCCLRSAAWEASACARLGLAEPMGEYAL